MKVTLETKKIKALLVCAAVGDLRYYLNGILLEVGKDAAYLVATDGHRLLIDAVLPDAIKERVTGLYILPRDECERIVKRNDKFKTFTLELFDNTRNGDAQFLASFMDNSTLQFACVSGVFPEWRRVFPTLPLEELQCVADLEYMGDMYKVAKILSGKEKLKTIPNYKQYVGRRLVFTFGESGVIGLMMGMDAPDFKFPSIQPFKV